MKLTCTLLLNLITLFSFGQDQVFVTDDITNFWKAYDKIVASKDTAQQYRYLHELYLDKGTAGLKALVEVRNYTDSEYIRAIHAYPKFWKSVRKNTLNAKKYFPAISADIKKLRILYPELQSVPVYFCIGVFRTGGTIKDKQVLIGSEFMLVDSTVDVSEMPESRKVYYKNYSPKRDLALTCTHEYVHTQQKDIVYKLYVMCFYEGIAEFISCLATGKPSRAPAIAFGKANTEQVVTKYVDDLFLLTNNYNWLWGENRNELKVRDLGYYIGYEMSERYYNLSTDKAKAIKDLIELDFPNNDLLVERIIDTTRLLPKPIEVLFQEYEKKRPTVISFSPFSDGERVKPGMTKITVTFSEPLNGYNTSMDFGPLGKAHFPVIKKERVWSNNNQSWTFEADLKPNMHYQILISNNFRLPNGIRLKPMLLDFTTSE